MNFSVVLVCGRAIKLLLVSINFSLVIVQLDKVIQEIQLEVINTIVYTLFVTQVQQAIHGSYTLVLEPDASMIILP